MDIRRRSVKLNFYRWRYNEEKQKKLLLLHGTFDCHKRIEIVLELGKKNGTDSVTNIEDWKIIKQKVILHECVNEW